MQVTIENVKIGMILYCVNAFADNRFDPNITQYKVEDFLPSNFVSLEIGSTIWKINQSNWETQQHFCSGKITDHSLRDMGIIPNNYNEHKTFTSLLEAQQHAAAVHRKTYGNMASDPSRYDRAMAVLDL